MPIAAVEAGMETGAGPSEMALRAVALVDAYEGHLERAQTAATDGIERTEGGGSGALTAAWLQVTALVAASRGDAAAVEEATGRAWHHLARVGYVEPMRLDPSPERIEALAILGRRDEARVELAGLEARNRRVAKPWAAAAIARGRARIAIADGDIEAAIVATSTVAAGPPPGWSRFDIGRALLVRGEALRHSRSRRDSEEALRRAHEIFVDLGATVWAQRATAERARPGLDTVVRPDSDPDRGPGRAPGRRWSLDARRGRGTGHQPENGRNASRQSVRQARRHLAGGVGPSHGTTRDELTSSGIPRIPRVLRRRYGRASPLKMRVDQGDAP